MKKIIAMLICSLTVLCFVGMASAAFTVDKITPYTVGSQALGKIADGETIKVYEFTIPSSGKIKLNYSALIKRSTLKLYDASEKEIWASDPWSNSSTNQISLEEELYLVAGKYYLYIAKNNGFGDFNFEIDFTQASESFAESQSNSNDATSGANAISFSTQYSGQIALNDNSDYHKFSLTKSGKIKVSYNAQIKGSTIKVHDGEGKEVWSANPVCNANEQQVSFSEDVRLTSGTYYFSVTKQNGCGNYNFKIDYTAGSETFAESQGGSNNTIETAELAGINLQYAGQLAANDDVDIYKFSLATHKKVKIAFNTEMKGITLRINDASGKMVWKTDLKSKTTQNQISFAETTELPGGSYYLYIEKSVGHGNYVFFISDGGKVEAVTNPITVLLNGERIRFDQMPIIENGRTLVPVRAIFEALQASVHWDNTTRTITSQKGNITIKMTIGDKIMYKNGNPITLDTPPRIVNTRTLVPARAVAEAYGCTVNWDNTTRTVIIKG